LMIPLEGRKKPLTMPQFGVFWRFRDIE